MSLLPLNRFSNGWHPVSRQPLSSRRTIAIRKTCGREVEATIDEPSLCIEEKPSDGGMVSKRSRCCKRFQRAGCEGKMKECHKGAPSQPLTPEQGTTRLASIPLSTLDDRHDLAAISQVGTGEKSGKKSRDATEVQTLSLQAISPGERIPRLPGIRRHFGLFN